MASTFVWIDIPVRDIDRAVAFYSAVCARDVEKMQAGEGFAMGLFPHEGEDVAGCLYASADGDNAPSMTGPLVYIDVTGRLDDAIAAVEPHGGRVMQARHSIGPYGWRAVVADSEGNRVALHSRTA